VAARTTRRISKVSAVFWRRRCRWGERAAAASYRPRVADGRGQSRALSRPSGRGRRSDRRSEPAVGRGCEGRGGAEIWRREGRGRDRHLVLRSVGARDCQPAVQPTPRAPVGQRSSGVSPREERTAFPLAHVRLRGPGHGSVRGRHRARPENLERADAGMADYGGPWAGQPRVPASWGRICPHCSYSSYPTVTPAILVLVHDEDRVLLVHKIGWTNRRSIIAGFVEPGETLEECARREIQEEVGAEVTDITYVGNQPWPYPDQLMVGFTARYSAGPAQPDNVELDAADWYTFDNLPELPPPLSLARQIIMQWVSSRQQQKTSL